MKKCLLVSLIAGACASATAFAQVEAPKLNLIPGEVRVPVVGETVNPYSSRVIQPIWDNTGNLSFSAYVSGVGAGQQLWANDFSFTGTPWAGQTGRVAASFSWLQFNASTTGPNTWYTRVTMYRASDFSYAGAAGTGTPMVAAGATPFYDVVVGPITFNANTGSYLTVTPTAGIPIPDGTDNFVFVMQSVTDATGTTPSPAGTSVWGFTTSPASTATNDAGPGTGAVGLGRDQNANGVLDGTTTFNGTFDHRQTVIGGRAAGPAFRLTYDGPAPAPTPTFDFGCIADGVTNRTDTIAANGVAWYRFCLNGDATDDAGTNGRFFDAWTAGSSFDTVMALYSSTGALLASSGDFGIMDDTNFAASDFSSLFTTGVGRRAPVSTDGAQRDGRCFDTDAALTPAGLPAGTYFMAVGGFGLGFGPGFAVSGTSAGGSLSFAMETNVNGGALAPSVAPAGVDLSADLGQLVAPGGNYPSTVSETGQVHWVKFETCRNTTASDTVTLSFVAANQTTGWTYAVFNSAGNRVATGLDPNTAPADVVFNDTNPLPAGTYYLALTFTTDASAEGADFAQLTTTDGRWHMRCTQLNGGFEAAADILVSWADCPSAGCYGSCVADYDDGSATGTPDGGVGIEDLLYYLGVYDAGTACADVDDGSATNTLDGGVGIEDLLYYLQRYDAGC